MSNFDKNNVIELTSSDYKKESNSLGFGNIFPIIVPLALVYSSSKGKNNQRNSEILSNHSPLPVKNDYQIIEKSEQIVGNLSNAIDLMKKVNKINDIRKISTNGSGNVENIKEAFTIFKDLFAGSAHMDQINTLENTITTFKKFSDVKKILDTTSALTSNSVSKSSSKPQLSSEEDNSDTISNLEKIVKMANIVSTLSQEK